ncbi:contactin-associated protein-like 5 isoform X1 [Homo sapiens]|uniref:contactin-associated protein-like 5 isoform X1 n=1 Tax=Homo sapiens TaxID=9606 RepID=UPI0007DC73C2|nr:contactin-associated protein-like 5 isoform X1 [Homo sapiens]XP_054196460.1 contactin-associated protein-like 5 isoform X1 [Homo sapiens]|eukprot:XP_016858805.1 contactin-associated protein-like 5 isoform X2 [Homo sapiens]
MDSLPRLTSVLTLLFSGLWHLGLTATNYNCDDPLASLLSPMAFSSSSDLTGTHSPAQLNWRVGTGGWSPADSNAQQWLQMDLGNRVEITAVATQGRYGSSDWVTSYSLMFSDTGRNWKQYKQEDSIWTFAGNMNADSVVHHKLLHSVRARFVRFVPLEWNPSGKIGMRVEVYGCSYKSDVADFDGRSSLLYRFNQKLMSTLKDVISLKFKSMQGDGVLFHGEGQRGDHITLELQKGRLALHLNLGDSKARLSSSLPSATLGSLLDDQHWHSVLIERVGKQVNFTVDKHTQHFRTKGETDALDIDYELSFGGIPVPGKPGTFLKKNFHGCIENLYYNGVNIIDLAKRRKHQIYTVGNVTFSCSEPQIVPITFVNSSGSYLLLPGTPQIDGLSVSFQFRTWNKDGLLLSTELSEGSGTLLLSLEGGILRLVIQKMTERVAEILTGSNLNDGLWHSVSINARRNRITLTLDDEAAPPAPDSTWVQIYSGNSYYFGGCPDNLTDSQCLNPIKAFQGCMRLIFIDNQPKDLISVQQGSLGNFSDLHIDLCSIKDRCLPNYCEHGGSCSQSWTTFYCNCSDTSYTGATCHNSIYEQSCEVYRHQGNTAGFFYIDSDGSGPLGPLQVYCNITEDKIWTSVQHNNTELTRVRGANPEKPYAMALDYGGSMEQLEAVIDGSEHCEQEVAYHCRRSRLLNTPDGTPFTWWIGRSNERHPYWGGSPPGVQQCECGLDESCLDIQHFCNCDADKDEWTNDTGFLSFKDHLPVTQIVITDTDRSNSEAAWRIGPLRCYGDRRFWNAVSFYTEASYLHFPTFHAEFSADISFFFKTTALSGVFLENLGIKDFIRLEISSPSEITFAIDVGNGPVELVVQSPSLLNDNQWHYVRAERNLKETSLQVDNLPRSTRETSEEGHFRLQLNSQLFVEVSAVFEAGTSVTYMFQEPYPVTKNISLSSSAIYTDSAPSKENIALSFVTTQAPSLLLFINSSSQDFVVVLLCKNGSLQVRYHLNKEETHVFTIDADNFANRRMHHLKINREGRELTIQMDQQLRLSYNFSPEVEFRVIRSLTLGKVTENLGLDSEVAKANAMGFAGCMSSVQYNHIAPLKAALRHATVAPVTVHGTLTESSCGFMVDSDVNAVTTVHSSSDPFGKTDEREPLTNAVRSDSAVIGGVIAVVIFIIFCIIGIMTRFLYQHKQSHRTSQMKEKEYPENLDSSFRNEIDLQNTVSECKREYFI